MTRLQIADSIILDLGYNDVEAKPDQRQIYIDIDKHLPLILVQVANQFGEGILNNFTTDKILPVSYDTGYSRYCVDLTPVKSMNIKGYSGIRYLGDTNNEDMEGTAVPIQTGFTSMMSILEVGGMAGRYGYYLVGNRAYIKNAPINMPDVLRCRYVPTMMGLSDTDEVTCPAETLSMISDKLSQVLMIQKQTPENVANDNKDNQ